MPLHGRLLTDNNELVKDSILASGATMFGGRIGPALAVRLKVFRTGRLRQVKVHFNIIERYEHGPNSLAHRTPIQIEHRSIPVIDQHDCKGVYWTSI